MLTAEMLDARYDALLLSDEIERLRQRARPLVDAERRAIGAQVALASVRARRVGDPRRTRALEQEIESLAADRATLRALRRRETRLMLELERSRAKLKSDAPRRSLPLVREATVAAPCPVRWDELKGEGPARHCGVCGKDVYDLTAMPAEEAERTLVVRGGVVCVRAADGGTGFVGFAQ
jgi:DNA repair exonuclease SbcCD ATPase subunit